jgi:hypothetical protein
MVTPEESPTEKIACVGMIARKDAPGTALAVLQRYIPSFSPEKQCPFPLLENRFNFSHNGHRADSARPDNQEYGVFLRKT